MSTELIGVLGALVGGAIGLASSWLLHRWQRADRIAERSRAERKEAYAALLTSAEDCVHLFEWFVKGTHSEAGTDEARRRADRFYDENVTTRLRVLQIVGAPPVVKAAEELRQGLNKLRYRTVKAETPPTPKEYESAVDTFYRPARRRFIALVHDELESRPPSFGRRRGSRTSARAG